MFQVIDIDTNTPVTAAHNTPEKAWEDFRTKLANRWFVGEFQLIAVGLITRTSTCEFCGFFTLHTPDGGSREISREEAIALRDAGAELCSDAQRALRYA